MIFEFHSRRPFILNAKIELPDSGVIGVSGPSGSGKTSLLRCLAGLERSISGVFRFKENVFQDAEHFMKPAERKLGMVFQKSEFFHWLSVEENLTVVNRFQPICNEYLRQLIEQFGITHLLNRSVLTLSGGESQRLAVVRALMTQPDILLMDEPFSALDKYSRWQLLAKVRTIVKDLNIPLIIVSHDLDELSLIADVHLYVDNGNVLNCGAAPPSFSDGETSLIENEVKSNILDCYLDSSRFDKGLFSLEFQGETIFIDGARYSSERIKMDMLTTENISDGVNRDEVHRGNRLKCLLSAKEISISKPRNDFSSDDDKLSADRKTSMVNQLNGKIISFRRLSSHRVLVGVRIGKPKRFTDIFAEVTQYSVHELNLSINDNVFLNFKSCALQHLPF